MTARSYRWIRIRATATTPERLTTDLTEAVIIATPATGMVHAAFPWIMTPDEARSAGLLLIEAATLADNGRSVMES